MKKLDDKWMNVDGITSNLCCLPTKKRMKSSAGISLTPDGWLPSSKHTKNDGKSPLLIGKSSISMGHFP